MTTGLMIRDAGSYLPAVEANRHLSPEERSAKIADYIDWVEDQLLDQPQAQMSLEHTLNDGLYVRTMRAPAETILTGAVHKKACLTLLIAGEISILTEGGCALLKAPLVFPAAAGVRRLGHCHTDVVWATVHSVQGTTLDEIEDELFTFVAPEGSCQLSLPLP